MSKTQALQIAIDRAKETLAGVDIAHRCEMLALGQIQGDWVNFRAFGQDMVLDIKNLDITTKEDDNMANSGDTVLILHYLMCDLPIEPAGELITFRDFSGGKFYLEPFLSRTVEPLVSKIGNDLEMLEKHLAKFDWQKQVSGDFIVKIHGLGKLEVTLVYRKGDDEFPPNAEVLFDSCLKRVYQAEDVAYLASRICLRLLFS